MTVTLRECGMRGAPHTCFESQLAPDRTIGAKLRQHRSGNGHDMQACMGDARLHTDVHAVYQRATFLFKDRRHATRCMRLRVAYKSPYKSPCISFKKPRNYIHETARISTGHRASDGCLAIRLPSPSTRKPWCCDRKSSR